MDVHPSALKHGVAIEDMMHALRNSTAIDELDDVCLYLGPAHDGSLLEVITVVREGRDDLVIHAMAMRPKFQRLLPGG